MWRLERLNVSVVVHFEDTAFDNTHVSVPHSLMSEREKERSLSKRSKRGDCQGPMMTNPYYEIWAKGTQFHKWGNLCSFSVIGGCF